MSEFMIELAGKKVGATTIYEYTREYCSEFLCQGKQDFFVSITAKDLSAEKDKSAREDALEGLPVREYSDAYLESIAIQRKITEAFFDYDILLFHGSVVAVDGVAYLFTAKSGTGKSTHTRFWREMLGERAVMVNDDKPFLKFEDGRVLACGSPWNGKHKLGSNIMVPLKAICILERGETDEIRPISAQEALPMLFQQSARPQNPGRMGKYMELIDRLATGVEFYRLKCTMSENAARVAYEAMRD